MQMIENNQAAPVSVAAVPKTANLTKQILWAMLGGALCGLTIKVLPASWNLDKILTDGVFQIGGAIFINCIKMLVVPLVFISLLCGVCSLNDMKKLGKIGFKALAFFIVTTAFAVFLAVTLTNVFHIGSGVAFPLINAVKGGGAAIPSLQQLFIDIVPNNPFQAFTNANILQIIVFAIIFGVATNLAGEPGRRMVAIYRDLNAIIVKAVMMIMRITPYGVFCLIAILFAKTGLAIIIPLLNYFLMVTAVLLMYIVVVYSLLLRFVAHLSPVKFFKKMYSVMLFAFSVASSNATLPLILDTAEHKLGIDSSVGSLVLSLGVNMNKHGTAIMQGVAAVFIAHIYNVNIGFAGNMMIVLTTVLASISTAGVPSVGIMALVMVLNQVGLPVEGIAIILAVDRLLDMMRTVVNVAGNAVIACIIGKAEEKMDLGIYNE